MAKKDSDHKLMDEEIRDMLDHFSEVSDCRESGRKTYIYDNSLNQACTLQVQGSRDEAFTVVFDIGGATVVAAGTKDYETLNEFWPFMRVKAKCGVAPANGKAEVWVEKLKITG